MMLKILCITEPADYPQPDAEVPQFYRHLSRRADVDLFHVFTSEVTGGRAAQFVHVPDNLGQKGFARLDELPRHRLPVAFFDVAFCRTKKPFPPGYLDRLTVWSRATTFLNDPSAKTAQIAAGFMASIAGAYAPDTMVTDDARALLEFLETHGVVVVKRPNSTGGLGVFRLHRYGAAYRTNHVHDGNRLHDTIEQALTYMAAGLEEPVEAVRYLPLVEEGDKRIVVVDGEIYGAFLRRSKAGHWVNNTSSGVCDIDLAEITEFEREAIAATAPHYLVRGLRTLGYDFLMDTDGRWKISEINAGNIGGLARLQSLTGQPVIDRFVDWMREVAHGLQPPRHMAHDKPNVAPLPCEPA